LKVALTLVYAGTSALEEVAHNPKEGTAMIQSNRKRASSSDKIRYAVVGLGYIAQSAVLPAFAHAKRNCELVALVSDDAEKARKLATKYDVERTFSYDEYEDCLELVDAVYIALPNSMHRDFTVRAARAGVHVLCEKPMAVTEADCEAMIDAADENAVSLMIGYRLHFEKANLAALAAVEAGKIGEPRFFDGIFTMQVVEGDTRLQKALGGGSVYDLGIYCINAARGLFKAEPIEVMAASVRGDDPRFTEVDETSSAILRFPDERLAVITSSFGTSSVSSYKLVGTKGSLCLDPAFEDTGELSMCLTVGEKDTEKTFPDRDQFAPELIYFSQCILDGTEPEPSGAEGLADVRVIRAIYESARVGRPVRLQPLKRRVTRPTPRQEITKPAARKPKLFHAHSPSKE
jgi:predicted dehydrogenase